MIVRLLCSRFVLAALVVAMASVALADSTAHARFPDGAASQNTVDVDNSLSLANATITANPTSIVADGASTSTITVQMRDGFGNALSECPGGGEVLTLATDAGSLVDDTPDCVGGAYTATLTASGTPETATVTGSFAPGGAIADNATVQFTAALEVTTASLPSWTVDEAGYTSTLAATGGAGGYTWEVTAGDPLPTGLTLNANTGEISGTPTAAGTANFTVTVTDSALATDDQVLSITINAQPVVSADPLDGGQVSVAYSDFVGVTGGTTPYTWTLTGGALPGGLNLNGSTGEISGTPTTEETANFTITVTDDAGATDDQALQIVIAP